MEFIMNQLSNVFADVVGGLVAERNEQGVVMGEVILASEVITQSDMSVVIKSAEDWSDSITQEDKAKHLANQASHALSNLLKRNGVDANKLPTLAWYTEVRSAWVKAFMDYEQLEDFQRNTADQAWGRLYERAGFNAVPKATNVKAVAERERKEAIKKAKDNRIGKALSDAKQDVTQAIANANAKNDYDMVTWLTAKAKADGKASEKKADEALKPQKDMLCKAIRSCNNKDTLDKIAKLLG
jgi:hypothetical protein